MNRNGMAGRIYRVVLEGVSLVLLVAMCLHLIVNWQQFPDQIPGHYDSLGNVNRWGAKRELVIIPIIIWMLYLGMTVIGRFPQLWNTGVKITENNRERIYRILKDMIVTLKFLLVAMFVFLSFQQTSAQQLPSIFLPLTLTAMFGMLAIFLLRLWRNR